MKKHTHNFMAVITVFLMISVKSNGQVQLIQNGGFEEKGNLVSANKPDDEGQIDKAAYWGAIQDICHPDWYSVFAGKQQAHCPNLGGTNWENGIIVEGNSSSKYFMGIGAREHAENILSQSTLAGSTTQGNGSYVKVRLYYTRRGNFNPVIDGILQPIEVNFSLRLCLVGSGICSITHTAIASSSFIPSGTPCSWQYYEGPWAKINSSYDRFGIKTRPTAPSSGTNDCDNFGHKGEWYILIDDVELLNDICPPDLSCSRTDGHLEPLFVKQNQSMGLPQLEIKNLQNIKKAVLLISNSAGQELYTKTIECENGIDGSMYWTGFQTNGTTQVLTSVTAYNIKLTLTNDCGTFIFADQVVKSHNYTGSPVFDFQCNACNVVTPEPCCASELDIYIDNITICGPGIIEYKARNNIYIGSNVIITNNATVIFQAGNTVVGDPYQNAEPGADITVEISECPPMKQGNNPLIENNGGSGNESSIIPGQNDSQSPKPPAIMDASIAISPNPNNGSFSLSLVSESVRSLDIHVYDALGKVVYQALEVTSPTLNIDISGKAPGIYLVRVQTGEEQFLKKVVVQ